MLDLMPAEYDQGPTWIDGAGRTYLFEGHDVRVVVTWVSARSIATKLDGWPAATSYVPLPGESVSIDIRFLSHDE